MVYLHWTSKSVRLVLLRSNVLIGKVHAEKHILSSPVYLMDAKLLHFIDRYVRLLI